MLEVVTGMSAADWAVLGILAYGLGIAAGFGLKFEEAFSAKVAVWPVVVAVDFYCWALLRAVQWLVDGYND